MFLAAYLIVIAYTETSSSMTRPLCPGLPEGLLLYKLPQQSEEALSHVMHWVKFLEVRAANLAAGASESVSIVLSVRSVLRSLPSFRESQPRAT